MGFRVQGLGFRVQGLRSRVQGLGFGVEGVEGLGFAAAPDESAFTQCGSRVSRFRSFGLRGHEVVLQKSIPAQIRQLILCYYYIGFGVCRCARRQRLHPVRLACAMRTGGVRFNPGEYPS